MNILLIGFGSIGKRHYGILKKMKEVSSIKVITKLENQLDNEIFYKNIEEIESLDIFNYFIVANETYKHAQTLQYLVNKVRDKIILVEKPLFICENDKIETVNNNKVFVAYNLRFDPIIQYINKNIKEKILYVNALYGMNLSLWRQDSDYKKSYSASKKLGGGVLRDISHEIDYTNWLFGKMNEIKSFHGKISQLEITSEDFAILIGKTNKDIYFNISIDSISRIPMRHLIIHTNKTTYYADFVKSEIRVNEEIITFEKDRNISYYNMHHSILSNNLNDLCSYEDGLAVLNIIENIEKENFAT